jgi:hypothetical protein
MIGSLMKYFRLSYDYILWDIGYVNLVMLMASIPEYNSDDTEKENKETIDFGSDVEGLARYLNSQK